MNLLKKISVIFLLFICSSWVKAEKVCLCFSEEFLPLLKDQKNRYLSESSKRIIDKRLEKVKNKSEENFNENIVGRLRLNPFTKALGETSYLGEKAYAYIQAQDNVVLFSKTYCDEILKILEEYLKKTFAEYEHIIFYYELSPSLNNTTKEEYDECKHFLEYFKGYEDSPLEKLGNIFKKVNDSCTIQ